MQQPARSVNRILDTDAHSHFNRNMSYVTAMRTAVQEKKKKYTRSAVRTCWELHTFTVVNGVFLREFVAFMKRVAAALAEKWHISPMGW